jgi:hypothetical protein
MKHSFIITSLFATLIGGTAVAQSEAQEKPSFGIKAGFNYANVWDEQGQDFRADAKVGFAGGLFLGIPIGPYLGVQPEVLISQKGFTSSGTLLGTAYSFNTTKTYLDIPLQLQIKPFEYVTLVFGPQYSYLLHQKNVYTFGTNSAEQEQEFENDNIRKNVFGFVGGIDINIKHVVVSTRAGWDLVNNNGDGSSTTPRYKNQWLQLTVGFKI